MSALPRRKPVDLEFVNITYAVPTKAGKEKKTILKNVAGKFYSGKLTAIMGPSGAGKTSLMHICAGFRTSHVKGSIMTNGKERDVSEFRRESCYIMQDDHHLPHLTVKEAMNISASLKLERTTDPLLKSKMINEILDTLGLKECLNTRTSCLSGGQRKRLSIAVELINNPPVMLLDEPTSGLDSQNSYQCIKLLRGLAKEGRTIICTIHQPSSRLFEMFEFLFALSDGQCIYRGCVVDLIPYLSSMDFNCPSYHNPGDYLIEVATSENYSEILASAVLEGRCDTTKMVHADCENTQNNEVKYEEGKSLLTETETKLEMEESARDVILPTLLISQVWILLKRNNLSIIRDTMLTKLRVLSHIVVGILLGILFLNVGDEASKIYSNSGFIFCCVLFTVFAGMMPTILTFPLEMKVFIREHHNCWYSVKGYYLAKTLADIPFQIIYPIIFVSIAYFMTNQPHDISRFSMFTAICILTSFVAQSLALVIGIAFEMQAATYCAPVVSIPILMFSGFFVTKSTIPVYIRWLTNLSYMRFGYEGAMLAIYGYGRGYLQCSQPFCQHRLPSKYLEVMDLDANNYWVDIAALLAFVLGLRILGFFVLKMKLKRER